MYICDVMYKNKYMYKVHEHVESDKSSTIEDRGVGLLGCIQLQV